MNMTVVLDFCQSFLRILTSPTALNWEAYFNTKEKTSGVSQ